MATLNTVPYTKNVQSGLPLAFITKEDEARRVKEFTKTPKEKAQLATAKAGHRAEGRGMNSKKVTNKITTEIVETYNLSELRFSLINLKRYST